MMLPGRAEAKSSQHPKGLALGMLNGLYWKESKMKNAPMMPKYRETLISGVVSLLLMVGMLAALIITGILFATNRDERIESAARRSFALKTRLQDADIQVYSQDGVVTLTGTVDAQPGMSWAADTVAALPGVIRVDNRLEVRRHSYARPGNSAGPAAAGSRISR